MYCPQCATANAADVKFCRSCGLELEALVSALTRKPDKKLAKSEPPEETWIDQRIKGVSSITRGSILMAVSFFLILPFALFLPASFDAPWILIWTVFFGWMTVWGGIEVAYGLSSLLESRSKMRLLGEAGQQDGTQGYADSALNSAPRASVTERTTRHLNE